MALLTWAFMAAVLVLVLVLIVLRLTRGSTTVPTPAAFLAPESVVKAMTSIPTTAFDAVGAPGTSGPAPQVLTGQSALSSAGRAEVVFVGGEFSPYSAAARWAVVAALARFGTFANLGATSSSTAEAFGRTPTFTFAGATYRSPTVALVADEAYGATTDTNAPAGFPVLSAPSGTVQALLRRFDGASPAGGPVTLPFLDVGNRVVFLGAGIGFSPGLLHGQSMAQVAAALSDPTSALSRAVLGTANEISAALCASTTGRPADVCSSAGVRAATTRLGLG